MHGSRVRLLVALVFSSTLPACSTVIRTADAPDDPVITAERAALKDAAETLAETPWPTPTRAALPGTAAGPDRKLTRERAVELYIASLAGGDAQDLIVTDASRHLAAAASLAGIAERQSDGPDPLLSDVAVLEAAISNLRETRAVYLSALKKVGADKDAINAVREPLDEAVKKLGVIADALAENAMKRRALNFAGPEGKTAHSDERLALD